MSYLDNESMEFELDMENAHCPIHKYQSHVDLFLHLDRECDWVFLGDSITNAGRWGELFPNMKVSNQGIDGDTTKGMLARVKCVTDLNPQVVFIMSGINDIIQGRSIDEIMHCYIRLISVLCETGCKVVIQSTLLTSNSIWNTEVRLLNQALESYALQHTIPFVDLNHAFGFKNAIAPEATFDGVHLQAAMYIPWSQQVENLDL